MLKFVKSAFRLLMKFIKNNFRPSNFFSSQSLENEIGSSCMNIWKLPFGGRDFIMLKLCNLIKSVCWLKSFSIDFSAGMAQFHICWSYISLGFYNIVLHLFFLFEDLLLMCVVPFRTYLSYLC